MRGIAHLTSGSIPIKRLRNLLKVLFRTNALDDRVRRTLVETLYTQPSSLAIGALCGAAAATYAAYASQNAQIWETAIALSLLGLVRVVIAHILPRLKHRNVRSLELMFEIGAFSFALLTGVIAAQCVHYDAPLDAQLLTVANATAYGVAIAARNAGRPLIAIGQLLLALIPEIIVFAFKDGLGYKVLAVSLALVLLPDELVDESADIADVRSLCSM